MSETPETPQQRQARIRQQKREAKLKSQGQERLDKITMLSGRTPETVRRASPGPEATATPVARSTSNDQPSQDPDVVLPTSALFGQSNDPQQQRIQEEYMRTLLGVNAQNTGGPGQEGSIDENDPMIQMMQTMFGGMSGDPNAPSGMPFSADEVSKMTGIPSFLTGMFLGGPKEAPPSPAQIKRERTWKIVRALVSLLVAIYTVFTVDQSVSTFGQDPPAPATAQNPFVVFLMAELLIHGAKIVLADGPATGGLKSWFRTGKDAARDGAIVVFMLGMYSWFTR